MVSTLLKSTLREIRQSLGRYLAILAIIALGVGFFAGLRMSQPNMLATGVEYIEKYNLYDFRLMSTLGFTEEDIAVFAALDGIEAARGAVFTDFLADWQDREMVFTALSLTEDINEPQLTVGWMPRNGGECLGDARFFTEEDLGKTITVMRENDEDTLELLREERYTLVGLMHTPYFLNQDRGISALGGGSVGAFIYIPESGFDFEAYYEVFLKITDAADAYSEEYQTQIDALKPTVERLLDERAQFRYDSIYGDALAELRDAETEVSDGWSEYESEKAKAEQELADALAELTDGEEQYLDGVAELEQGRLDYADGLRQYEDGIRELEDAKRELDDAKSVLDDGAAQLSESKAELDSATEKLDAIAAQLDEAKKQLDDAKLSIDKGEAAYTQLSTLYQSAVQLAQGAGMATPAQLIATLNSGAAPQLNAAIDQALKAQGGSLTEFLDGWFAAEQSIGQELTEEYLNAMRATLDDGAAEYEAGLAEYESGFAQYEEGKLQYEDGLAQYESALADYEGGVKRYEDGKAEYEDGVRELADVKRELEDAAKEIADAETELEDARAELDDGWREYEDGKAEAEQEFADAFDELTDAEAEIADAYRELNDLREADTYTLTREENAGYMSYNNDTSIIKAVSVVFPAFFFLVAALVCVTTMTRMVDEQRTQIGVLKALGYSNAQIMGKYLFYSGSAAVVGSVGGYALGSTALPWIIWEIYGIMYDFAPLTFLFDPVLAALSFAAALLCSVGATYAACRAELRRTAAQLIRPKTPKAGKRVFLEYITPIWSRLSFLHKVSVRNVLRYRSRLVMMVLGIGGCTALLVTGMGLKDSLTTVIDEQFEKITLYDYSVTFREGQSAEEIAAYLAEKGWNDGLLTHSGNIDVVTDGGTKSVYLVIAAEGTLDGYISLRCGDEMLAQPGVGEVVLNEGLARWLDISVGDEIRLRCDNGATMRVTVSAVCDNYVNNYAYIHPDTYAVQIGETAEYQTLFLHAHEGADPYAEGAKLADDDDVSRVSVNEASREQVLQMLSRLDYLVVIVVVCAGALAFIVLYNLTNINITERIREIATIKVLGFYRKETASYVFREIYILAVLGSLAGVVMGKALHAFVMAQVQIDAVYFPCIIHPVTYVYAVALTIGFTVLISKAMKGRLHRIDMAESLKSVE